MDSATYWLWTIFIAFVSYFIVRAICSCRNYYYMEPRYRIFYKVPKEMDIIKINKIDYNTA